MFLLRSKKLRDKTTSDEHDNVSGPNSVTGNVQVVLKRSLPKTAANKRTTRSNQRTNTITQTSRTSNDGNAPTTSRHISPMSVTSISSSGRKSTHEPEHLDSPIRVQTRPTTVAELLELKNSSGTLPVFKDIRHLMQFIVFYFFQFNFKFHKFLCSSERIIKWQRER